MTEHDEPTEAEIEAECERAMAQPCVVCGKSPAEGWAFVNGDRYCHPDKGDSCYVGA